MINFLKENKFRILGWLVFLSSYLCYFTTKNEFKYQSLFNADLMGIPSLYFDIFKDGGKLSDWYLASAPTLFPDFTLCYVLFDWFGLDFVALLFVYGLIQTTLIVWLSIFILEKTLPKKISNNTWLIPVFFSFTFLESYYFTQHDFFANILVSPCYHGGALTMTLACLAVYLSDLNAVVKYVLFFIFCFLGVFSDMLFIPLFVAPFFTAKIVLFKFGGIKSTVFNLILLIISSLLAFKLYNYVNESSIAHFIKPNILAVDNINLSWQTFYSQMKEYICMPGFRSIQIAFSFIAPVVCFLILMFFYKRLESGTRFILLFYSGFSVIVFATPIINGSYIAWDIIRYSISPIFFSMAFLGVAVAWLIDALIRNVTLKKMALYAVPVFFLAINIPKFSFSALNGYFDYYPVMTHEIDSIAEKHHLRNGIADYWNSKNITMFSKNGITIRSVYRGIDIFPFGGNISWFYNREFDFVISDYILAAQIKKYLVITDSIKTPHFLVLKVKKFVFPPGEVFPKCVDSLDLKNN